MSRVEGILLAAGESRRMKFPKPLLTIDGRTFVEHVAALMLATLPRLVIVIGAHRERVRPAIARDPRVVVVENPDFALGQLSSLKRGLAAISPSASAAMVHLVDHPLVKAETFAAVARAAEPGHPIVVACHLGRRGHPVLFASALFDELERAPLAAGARVVVNAMPSRVLRLEVDDPGVTLDLDTSEDLRQAGLGAPPASR